MWYIIVVMLFMVYVCFYCVRVVVMYYGGMEILFYLFIFIGLKYVLIQV